MNLSVNAMLDLSHTRAKSLLEGVQYPWEALAGIGDLILELGATLGEDYIHPQETVWIHI